MRSNHRHSVGGRWIGLLTLVCAPAAALGLQATEVANGIYALVGPTENRTYDNYAINANLGFIVTPEGVVLVDSGATVQSGPLIEQAHSRIRAWRDTFHAMEALEPKVVVPGHGNPADLAKAKRDTGDYLDWLVREVEGALGNWEPIDETVERLAEAPDFAHLEHFEGWNQRNLNQTYLQLEAE